MGNLSNQVYIYSLSTDVFFSEEERNLKLLKDRYHDLKRLSTQKGDIKAKLKELSIQLTHSQKGKEREFVESQVSKCNRQLEYLEWLRDTVFKDNKVSNARLKRELNAQVDENDSIRTLETIKLNKSQTISLFESTLTRQLKLETGKLSEKLIIVEVYNYGIFKSLLDKGFNFKNKHFVYWSSSSGQIRDKKAVFIQEDAWNGKNGIENAITAGLSIEEINDNDGMSVNKFLAYKSLASSASEKWENFSTEKCIVVDDVKVSLKNRTVDFISRDTFDVKRDENRTVDLEITDGAGMMLPKVSERLFGEGVNKNIQFRLPWMKGCLSPVPWNEFGDNLEVTDIYGKRWKLNEESGIEIIFFKSQFKMWKHFIDKSNVKESWKKYQDNFKQYNCEAAFMNAEEDSILNAKTNYQYLQSLVYIENKDLMDLVQMTNDDLINLGTDADTMIRVLGCEDENDDKNEFQQAINLYPALLNDKNSKEAIKKRKEKIIEEAKSAKLSIDGKYTYVLPDWFAVMENIFKGIKNPKGLLNDGQVYCNLYDEGKVDLMRAPALSFEHAIRENIKTEEMKKWFITKGIHISADDLIPKILMADFDGDKIMCTPSKTLIKVIEDNAERLDIVPLEYEMGVSDPKLINSQNIFESLKIAFKANIGIISNTISKIYNKNEFDPKSDYNLIKKMTSYNNHIIDMAKTLDEVKLPPSVKTEWNKYDKQKLPYFFTYAKNKENVMNKNQSTVNRVEDAIIDKRIHFKSVVGKFDYRKLLWTPNIKDEAFVINEEIDNKIIEAYTYLDQNKRHYISANDDMDDKKQFIYIVIRQKLLEIYPDANKIADVLVRYLFGVKDSKYKRTLWESFGTEVVNSIRKNVHKEIDCSGCGVTVYEPRQRQIRCDKCQNKYRLRQDKERKRKVRQRLNDMSA
ncbi:hypothetical protein M1D47_12390 [Bacillus sp. R1-10]